jgi:photosystem II stability/assembly factor-like uncharacterized protein
MRSILSLALFCTLTAAFAQEPIVVPDLAPDGGNLSKPEERAKFHPVAVRGMSAADRKAAFEARNRLKAASYFGGTNWRNVGPEIQGGRVIDIDSPAGDPSTVLVSFATGGLYRTKDDGINWEPLFDDQDAFGIGSTAVSRDGKTIWVGTGEANSQRTSYAGAGIFKSTDSGKTWTNMGLPESHHIGDVVIDPRDENVVYVAALGHLYSQNPERGLYKTTDGGKTWNQILKGDEYTGAIDVVVDPTNSKHLLVSLWDRDRRAWNFRESGKGSAVMQSYDGGKTWSKVTGLPSGDAAGRTGLAMAADGKRVYAFVDNNSEDPDWAFQDEFLPGGRLTPRRFLLLDDEKLKAIEEKPLDDFLKGYPDLNLKGKDALEQIKAGKLTYAQLKEKLEKAGAFTKNIIQSEAYRSDDGGKTWSRLGRLGSFGGYYWGKVFVNPTKPDEVFVTGLPLLRSTNGGKTWESVAEDAHVDHHSVFFDPRQPGKVWIGNDGGIYVSYDDGTTVRHLNNLSVAQATTLAVDNKRPYNVIVGLQDNGTIRTPSNYRPGKSDKSLSVDLFGGDGSAIAVDPRNDGDLVYVAYQFGQHFAVETGKETRSITPRPPKGTTYRFNWISPIIISSFQPDILYLGSQFLHRSFNQGRTWEVISPDLTKNREQGDVPHSTLKDISESPLKFGLIYTGADDGTVKMTPDGGNTWRDISTPQPNKWVSRIVASKYDVNVVFCAQSGYREDDFSAYLWKSTDQGKTWKSIVGNLPAETINVVREDPKDKNILYVGTDMGVYVSLDGGTSWMTLHGGFPNLPVHDLVIQERADDLVAATHARGAYIYNLKPIRRYLTDAKGKDLVIFDVNDLKRGERWGLDRRDPYDATPPTEPKLTGTVFTELAGKGKIRLKDKDGKVVREMDIDAKRGFNAFELSLQLTPGKPGTVDVKNRKPATVGEVLADPRAAERPTYVPIGDYTLDIEVAGKTNSVSWKLN